MIYLIFFAALIILLFALRAFVSRFCKVPEDFKREYEKRKENEAYEKIKSSVCFICGKSLDVFDKNQLSQHKCKKCIEDFPDTQYFGNLSEEKIDNLLSDEEIDDIAGISSNISVPTDKEKFIEAFSLNVKPYHDIPEEIKRNIILKNAKLIKGLSEEEYLFFAETVYDIVINGNGHLHRKLRDFLFEKFKLKFKYMASWIVDQQVGKANMQLHRIELLDSGFKKARWVYLGGRSEIESHKKYHDMIFDLEKGLFDRDLNRYIFPTDLENCNCRFIAVTGFEKEV